MQIPKIFSVLLFLILALRSHILILDGNVHRTELKDPEKERKAISNYGILSSFDYTYL